MDKRTLSLQEKCERYICTLPGTDSLISRNPKNISCEKLYDNKNLEFHCEEKMTNLGVSISLHGFPFIVNSSSWFGKFVWSLICFLACASVAYFSYVFAWQFVSQKEVATVSYDSNYTLLPIPKVTICNLNTLKRSTLGGSVFENLTILDDWPPIDAHIKSPDSSELYPAFDRTLYNSYSEQHGKAYVEGIVSKVESMFYRNFENNNFTWKNVYKASDHIDYMELKRHIQLTRKQLEEHGHKPFDTMISGHIEGYSLQTSEVSDYMHPTYGRCFSLNTIPSDFEHFAGTLSLTLNLEADEYISFLSPAVGAVLSIHDPDEGFAEASAIKVAPGEYTHLTIAIEETTRTEHCQMQSDYNMKECRRQCLHRQVRSLCGCSNAFDENIKTRCLMRNKNHYVCSRFLEILHQSSKLPCVCPNKCKENVFKLKPTKVKWPSDKYMPHLKMMLSSHGVNFDSNEIRENIAQVSFSMDTSSVKKIRIAPQTMLFDLLVKVGGISALLTGISIITVLEILWVFCVAAIGHCCRKIALRKPRNNYVKQSEQESPNTDPKRITQMTHSNKLKPGNAKEAALFQRKDSNILRRMSTRKRLGANRRRSNRSASQQQEPDIFITPFPLLTSTVRQNKNTSSGESGVASIHRLISNRRSSEDSYGHNDNFSVAQPKRERDRIVPRLNLRDLAGSRDTSFIRCSGEQRLDNNVEHSAFPEESHNRKVINSDMKRVFNEIRRHHSDASDLRQLVYQPTRGTNNIRGNRFLP